MRESPRMRRLRTDLKAMERLKSESTILDFAAYGNPAEKYLVRFYGKGLYLPEGSTEVRVREQHDVLIELGASYPRMIPTLQWKSPIFHPNVSASGVVCLGGYGTHWVPSLNLDELCEMLWEMIRYANYDVDSPYNREAATWTREQKVILFPVDHRPIRDRVARGLVKQEPAAHEPPSSPGPAQLGFVDDEIIEADLVESQDEDIVFLD